MRPLIVFDLDGTLVDSRQDLAAAVQATLSELGHPPLPDQAILAQVGRGVGHLLRGTLPPEARDDASVAAAVERFRGHYGRALAEHTRPYPGVPEALGTLAGRAALAVLTNKPGDLARRLVEAVGLGPHLSLVLGGGDVPALKPDPGGLREAFRRIGAAPEAGWYVGDMPLDVQTGRRAGCRVAAVSWGLTDSEALEAAGPDRLLASPDELTGLP